jgi:hypothetical protein
MGDYSGCLLEAFKRYNTKNCDFLVCACNTRFKKPYKKVEDYPHEVICKTVADDPNSPAACDFANSKDRDCILKHLSI